MIQRFRALSVILGTLGVSACATAMLPPAQTLPKGQPVPAETIVARHAHQFACTDYDPASDSCKSLSRIVVDGSSVVAVETGAVRHKGDVHQVEIVSRGTIEGDQFCVDPANIWTGTSSLPTEMNKVMLAVTRSAVKSFGGVCTRYYQSADSYVASNMGRNGKPFPPGDTRIRFVDTNKTLRPQ